MEEHTLMLAKNIARQSLEDDENEAIDGSPKPLRKNHASRLEAKLQGFRYSDVTYNLNWESFQQIVSFNAN